MRDIKKRLENTCGSENEKFEKFKNPKFLPSENFEKERIGEPSLANKTVRDCWRTFQKMTRIGFIFSLLKWDSKFA